jgi:SAM-dependent MidA family methyltransferase
LQYIVVFGNFTSLAYGSRAVMFSLASCTTQRHFLAALNIHQEMQVMAAGDDTRFARLANQARQLMLPGEMGERFKAMAWLRGLDLPLAGFALQDLRHTL